MVQSPMLSLMKDKKRLKRKTGNQMLPLLSLKKRLSNRQRLVLLN